MRRPTVALLGCAAALAALPASAYGDTTCAGTAPAVINDNVVVPAGQTCELDGTTVNGNVRVLGDAVLRATGAEIDGNVQGENARNIRIESDSLVTLNVQLGEDDTRLRVANSEVGGNVEAREPTGAVVTASEVGGDIQIEGATDDVLVHESDIGGGVLLKQNTRASRLRRSDVGGDVQVLENTLGPVVVRNNDIEGNVLISENSGPNRRYLFENDVARDVQFTDNTGGPNMVRRNHVVRNLQCTGNSAAPIGGGNTAASKQEQCAGL